MFGVAYCDRLTSSLYCTQFQDTAHLTTFEVRQTLPKTRPFTFCLRLSTIYSHTLCLSYAISFCSQVLALPCWTHKKQSVVVQVPNVKECLTTTSAFSDKSLVRDAVGRSDAVLTELPPSAFNARDVEQDLGRLLEKPIGTYRQLLGLDVAMGAMAALLSHLELLGDDRNVGHFRLLDLDLAGRMRLDNAAIDALQLLPTKREGTPSSHPPVECR